MTTGVFQKPPTQVEAVLSELRRALLEGEYVVGSRLNVDAISKELGVSRAPVRDALRILEGERQVVYEPHRGYEIAVMSLDVLSDLYRIRELLETEAVALAVPRLTPERIAKIRRAADETAAALARNDRVAATYANREFHFELCTAERHEHLVDSIRQAWNADAYRSLYLQDVDAARASADEHFAIADAAAAGDVRRVVELQNAHRDGELRSLLSLLGDRLAAPEGTEPSWRATTTHVD
ncbi:GntR family transcriptional regulator [Pimelobacter sp. 30-1]|uniref:GntR family transcriptional regulator n=1 Tax=Pimelobacter TaxID=2044 RepID=UPI001C05BC13|nr:GntR family transcriptional regulator [Pimelobacter sp. 30-1]